METKQFSYQISNDFWTQLGAFIEQLSDNDSEFFLQYESFQSSK